MVCIKTTENAAAEEVILGYTLPSLLRNVCIQTPNDYAFNQATEAGWQPLSNQAFQAAVELLALGLTELGLEKGDRVALLMHSDIHFCLADLGCLLANLVDVPIDLTQTLEHIIFVLQHSEAKVLVVSNLDLLTQVSPYLENTALQQIVVVTVPDHWSTRTLTTSTAESQNSTQPIPEAACLDLPMLLHPVANQPPNVFPCHLPIYSIAEIQTKGQALEPEQAQQRLQQLDTSLQASDLATIVYIPDEQGQLQGVMLTHENLSANALTSFAVIPGLRRGQEVVLSFLPLNHVLARTLLYGHISQGYSIYFSNPNHIMKHLQQIHPTILVTVPLLLEKIHSKILDRQKTGTLLERMLLRWALGLAQRYKLGKPPQGLYALQLRLADRLVFAKWRLLFGGQLTYLICGGATLRPELANQFAAAGLPIMNGYGLTQASAVVCCNRGELNRSGTVGVPIPGAEVKITQDQEILIRGPYVTPGYYKNPTATSALIDSEGWLHTGDLGQFTAEGFLQLTGLKKTLFKLSTGKYIAPQPIEQRLKQSPFVAEALVVGADQKFCAALLLPDLEALHSYALEIGLDLPPEALLKHPCILALYQAIVNMANCHLPYWATVKRFRLLSAAASSAAVQEKASLTRNRSETLSALAEEITALFTENTGTHKSTASSQKKHRKIFKPKQPVSELVDEPIEALCPTIPDTPCPVVAQSLNPRLTNLRTVLPFLLGTGINLPDLPSKIAKLTTIF